MGFGFSKSFVIVLFIAAILSFGFRDIWVLVNILLWYAGIKILWNIFTK